MLKYRTVEKRGEGIPEMDMDSAGGHGFGMKKQGTSSDHWIDEFHDWLGARGLTTPEPRSAGRR